MSLIRFLLICIVGYILFLLGCFIFQRKLLYMPTHRIESGGLKEWYHDGQMIGYSREVRSPETVWLFLHGNGGQASDRTYVLASFSLRDSVFIMEYPGYGSRPGSPSMQTINAAAQQAYAQLKAQFPGIPICVAAESLGSGPASFLATNTNPPDRIVLILPFDTLANVAANHFRILPVRLLLRDNWDNVAALKGYKGQLELIAATNDTVIPIAHARALATSLPQALLRTIEGDHNDWAGNNVKIQYNRDGSGS